MPFDIGTAVVLDQQSEAIPTTKFDISTAEDVVQKPVKSTKSISSFLRSIFKGSPLEQINTLAFQYGYAKEHGEEGLEEATEARERDIVEEGVLRQVEAPMMLGIGAGAMVKPLATAAMVGGFTIKDMFFNARRLVEEKAPETPPVIKDIVEIIDFVATGAMLGGGFSALKKFTTDRMDKLNLPKAVTIPSEQVEKLKLNEEAISKLKITQEQIDVSIGSKTPLQVPVDKVIDLAETKSWESIKNTISPDEVKAVEAKIEPVKIKKEISGLSKSVESSAVKEGLKEDFGELPSYETRNMEDIAKSVSEFVNKDYELAKKIALGEAPEVGGLRSQEIFTGIRVKALAEGDIKTLMDLAHSERATAMATELGQRIKALDPAETADPISAMREIQKLGKKVTEEEAKNLVDLSQEVVKAKQALEAGGDRLDYGRKRVEFEDYYNGLKEKAARKKLTEYVKPVNWGEGVSNVAGFAKALKASFDNSVIGRQGWKTLWTNPDVWAKNSARTFGDFYNSMTGKDAMKEVRADVLSRPNSVNGLYKREGLAVGVREEAYPTTLPEKIPILGNVFKGSQDAFTAWQYRTRADVFDRLVDVANKTNADIAGIGKVVNALTGRGHLGKLEAGADPFNNIFFSPRFLKSNVDLLTVHAFDKKIGGFARRQAAENLVKVVLGTSAVLATASALDKDSVEFDPTSSDFGKIKSGNTRFNVSGGMGSILTLASRIITKSSKSSTTGLSTPLNQDRYGAKTSWDVAGSFFEGKLSPMAGIVRDLMKGEDFKKNKPTIMGELSNLLTPLPITNAYEILSNPNSANLMLALIADGLGIGTNTYGTEVNWETDRGLEINQFKEKVGIDRFKEANKKFNDRYKEWFDKLDENPSYTSLEDTDKSTILSKKRTELKKDIFEEYHFKYKSSKKKLPEIK